MSVIRFLLLVMVALSLLACASSEQRERNSRELAETNLRLAVGYLKQGRLDASLEKLLKALEAKPDYAPVHGTLALIYQRQGELDKAEEHFRRALSLEPMDGATHNNYAVLLCQMRKFDEAEKEFLIALKSRGYKTPASAFENLGVCAMQEPNLKKAEKYFRRALQIDSRLPVSLLSMAQISLEAQRYLSGRAYLQRYLEVGPQTPRSLWLGIQIEKRLGDEQAVRNYADQLSRHFPDSNEMGLLIEMERAETTQ